MRPKGTWIAICLILAIGIFSTDYVKKRTEVAEDVSATALEDNERSTAELTAKSVQLAPKSTEMTKDIVHSTRMATAAEMPMAESMDDVSANAELSTEAVEKPENPALVRLWELDGQIERNRARESESTTSSRKAVAESEWMLWESELQRILGVLKEKLDEDAQEELMYEQLEWMKSREEEAVDASKKQLGSTMEEVNYNRSRAELTRARAYELAETYHEFFAE